MQEKHDFPPCIQDFRAQRLPKLSQRVLIPCMQKYSAKKKEKNKSKKEHMRNRKQNQGMSRTATCTAFQFDSDYVMLII